MTTDESLELLPMGYDSLDNPIDIPEFNWTVNGEDMTSEIRESGNVFKPSQVGDIQLEGMGNVSTRVDLLVLAGLPQSLSISHDLVSNSFPGGSEVILTVLGVDLAGNENPIDNVSWSFKEDAGTISPGNSPGEYVYVVGETGSWDILAEEGLLIRYFQSQ